MSVLKILTWLLSFIWLPNSNIDHVKKCQQKLLNIFTYDCTLTEIDIKLKEFDTYIYTQCFSPTKDIKVKTDTVLLHGFAGGSGVWVKDLDVLASKCGKLYVIDMIGFARSTTPISDKISQTEISEEEAEKLFVDSIEAWREAMNINQLSIIGHSFGGFIASLYTLKYPHRVLNLTLASPIGIAPAFDRSASKDSIIEKLWIAAGQFFYDLKCTLNSVLRMAGPFSFTLVRLHALWRYHNGTPLAEYTWRTNSLQPTSVSTRTENAIWKLLLPGAFAKKSLLDRFLKLSRDQIIEFARKTHIIYGDHDWMDFNESRKLCNYVSELCYGDETLLSSLQSFFCIEFVSNAGHQLHWDNPTQFCEKVTQFWK